MDSKRKKLLALASLPVAAALCFVVVANRTLANARTVYVVNHTTAAARVQVAGVVLEVNAGERRELALAEGTHQVEIAAVGREPEIVTVTLEGSFFERFVGRTVFALNVAGAAVLLWEEEEYGARPSGKARRPERLLFGERFVTIHDVDHPFQPFPQQVNSGEQVVLRTRVSVMGQPVFAIVGTFPDAARAMSLGELHLRPDALDESLLLAYAGRARRSGAVDRMRAFLRSKLVPVSVPWHRLVQDLAADPQAVAREYEALLAASPTDSGLLYLAGRLVPGEEGRTLYERAVAADPNNAFAQHALAVRLARTGAFEQARVHSAAAVAKRPADTRMISLNHDVRIALGEFAPLAKEARARLESAPTELAALRALLEALVADGKGADARKAAQTFRQEVRQRLPKDPQELGLHAELLLMALDGRSAELRDKAATLKAQGIGRRLQFQASITLGEPAHAETLLSDPPWTGVAALTLSLAYRRAGNVEQADAYREKAKLRLAAGSPDEAIVASLLAQEGPVDPDEIRALSLSSAAKAVVLTALGGECAALAKRFNTSRYFPYGFLGGEGFTPLRNN